VEGRDTQYPILASLDASFRAPRSVHLKRADGLGRMPNDHYETDYSTVERCLAALEVQVTRPCILDLGAGSGRWGKVARRLWPSAFIYGVEIRDVERPEKYDGWLTGDFPVCAHQIRLEYDLVIGNPPYACAEAFVRAGLLLLRDGGQLGFLLRLAFLEGQGRRDGLFKEFPPRAVEVCSKRPSFSEDGKTNATAFAFFIWQKGYRGEPRVRWL